MNSEFESWPGRVVFVLTVMFVQTYLVSTGAVRRWVVQWLGDGKESPITKATAIVRNFLVNMLSTVLFE